MKLALNLILYIFVLLLVEDESLALTDYQIKRICRNDQRRSTCIKNLQEKKHNLEKGKQIEIPVIPYKGNQNLNFKF